MTIQKKLFYSNTIIVLFSLLILLGIGGLVISIFKDRFLVQYSQNAEISESVSDVEVALIDSNHANYTIDEWRDCLASYNFRICIKNQNNNKIYSNLRHSEWEVVEEVEDNSFQSGKAIMYFMEGATIVATKIDNASGTYTLIAVSSPKGIAFLGMDRGLFEMFLIAFLITGALAIIGILLCSQIITKIFIRHSMKPLDFLNTATKRISEGNLEEMINYPRLDEFKPVCDSFDLMQTNLKQSKEKQVAYEKARTEMVSGISHDLRTPLTSIKGYVKGILDGVADTEEKQQQYLKIVYKKSCDMDILLTKLFYFSKLETGNMPFYMKSTDMKSMLLTYLQEKEKELLDYHIEMDYQILFQLKDELLCCNIDRDQMKRVFNNLIENSIKYAKVEHILLRIQMEDQDKVVKIKFCDNGIGASQEKLQHVFEQFYRGDESRTSKTEGNGLGLYVCRYIVEQQGGKINAYSDSGFCVDIILPKIEKER